MLEVPNFRFVAYGAYKISHLIPLLASVVFHIAPGTYNLKPFLLTVLIV